MATATAEPTATTESGDKKMTEYSAFKRVKGKRDALVKAIEDQVGDDAGTIMIFVGKAQVDTQPGPKNAMKAVGTHYDLDGDYDIVATGSIKHFPGLKTETQRGVKGL